MQHYNKLSELHSALGFPPPENPMLSIIVCEGGNACSNPGVEHTTDFYRIGFKKIRSGEMRYGKTKYDGEQGSMFFVKPRQVMTMHDIYLEEKGFFLSIHEDYLNGHALFNEIRQYHFFDYDVNEALHLSPKEEETMWELLEKIQNEYDNNQDEFSKEIMLGHISSILKYSQRFYKRQFLSRAEISGKTAVKFSDSLTTYFQNGKHSQNGLPTVRELASNLNVSPKYLSDVLKQETGKTAIDLIHIFLVSEAKNLLKGDDRSVSEIAYSLGFENLPYFSRLFKKETGFSPVAFKKMSLN